MPEVSTTDWVEDNVYPIAREAVDFFNEVLMLVVNRDSAQVANSRCPSRRTGPVHLQPGEPP
jgi:hypothetical protein